MVNSQGFGSGPSLAPQHMALIPAEKLVEIEKQYAKDLSELWANPTGTPINDRRFKGEAWQNPWNQATVNFYLLNSRHLLNLADAVEAEAKVRQRIRFSIEQMIDAMSPANFLATNPEAQQRLIDTQGESLRTGILNALQDLGKGKVSQTDESAFEVGKNVATAEGAVVYQTKLFQILQFKPLTDQVYERPYLMIPPCINKYYILDLQPESSMVRYLVEQGHTVYLISWKNPDPSMADTTWDDYIGAAVHGIETVQDISGQKQINILGFCVGGTITATALAVMAARDQHPAASLTLLTTLLDFSDTGILDVFVDEALVSLRENSIGGKGGGKCGMLRGVELANTFSFLRPNDLVWNYVVDNYLKGNSPPPFDLLYWNGDSTNLPGAMYSWYLRHLYLQNELKVPGKLTICGEKVDLGKIKCPVYLYASREDHIVPWWSAYESVKLLKGAKVHFVLGASGHIAGVINPPAKKKRNYWSNSKAPATADAWFDGAKEIPGSWWTDWTDWLNPLSGKKKAAPKNYGNTKYKVLEKAPGSYVKEKAID
jgi:polyhydroxyalkanoate synthase subunit PhaC